MASPIDHVCDRVRVLVSHFQPQPTSLCSISLSKHPCLSYSPPSGDFIFDTKQMRALLIGRHVEDQDQLFNLMTVSNLFNPRKIGRRVFVAADYSQPMEQQMEATIKRFEYLLQRGVFHGWLEADADPEQLLRKTALLEVIAVFDHALAAHVSTHFNLWYRYFLPSSQSLELNSIN